MRSSTSVKRVDNSKSISSGTGGIDYLKVKSSESREVTDSANFSDTSIRRRDSLSYVSKVDLRYEPNDDELKQITQLQRSLNNTYIKNE